MGKLLGEATLPILLLRAYRSMLTLEGNNLLCQKQLFRVKVDLLLKGQGFMSKSHESCRFSKNVGKKY